VPSRAAADQTAVLAEIALIALYAPQVRLHLAQMQARVAHPLIKALHQDRLGHDGQLAQLQIVAEIDVGVQLAVQR
jgi:hypothetical protein